MSNPEDLNPVIPQCFWCGAARHKAAQLGAETRGQEPNFRVFNYAPCEDCTDVMSTGVVCVAVLGVDVLDRPPLQQEGPLSLIAPTGEWVVVAAADIERLPVAENHKIALRSNRRICFEKSAFDLFFKQ